MPKLLLEFSASLSKLNRRNFVTMWKSREVEDDHVMMQIMFQELQLFQNWKMIQNTQISTSFQNVNITNLGL